ncbi:MAG: hypothetical protein IKT98_05850 [Selenomonadaceae bacterium]|nr:hypothetical protein [Selenomonadaceae bacterium]
MIHVCLTLRDETGRYSKFAGTTLLSIFENISKSVPAITVHLLHDNTLTPDNRDKFSYLAGRYGQIINFYNVEELCADKLEEVKNLFPKIDKAQFNSELFYKFLIPQLLSEDVSKAIYLDTNTVVNLDINELWRVELGEKILGVVPALSIGTDIHIQSKLVTDGFVKAEDYFTSGVMLMNLRLLRTKEEAIKAGMNFISEHNWRSSLDQNILNYCFALQTLKLPNQFNQFVRWARRNREPLSKKIYSYTGDTLQLEINEPFNRLWLEYFGKTTWFSVEAMYRIYMNFLQNYGKLNDKMKTSMRNVSAFVSGKTRAFFTLQQNVQVTKDFFSIRADEDIIIAGEKDSMKNLLDAMKQAAGKKIFIILIPKFPFEILIKAGFTFGKDFLNGMEFLSEPNKLPVLNSHRFLETV